MRLAAIMAALLALVACGVESPPEPPEERRGLSVTGEVGIGVRGRI